MDSLALRVLVVTPDQVVRLEVPDQRVRLVPPDSPGLKDQLVFLDPPALKVIPGLRAQQDFRVQVDHPDLPGPKELLGP